MKEKVNCGRRVVTVTTGRGFISGGGVVEDCRWDWGLQISVHFDSYQGS